MRLKLFYSPEGFGNVGYDFPPNSAPAVLNNANDGLSTDAATAKIAQLGQTVGRAGDPAILLEDREIPDGGFRLFFGKNDGVSNVIGFSTSLGIFVSNNTGQGYAAFWQIGINSNTFSITTSDALDTVFNFSGTGFLIWNTQSPIIFANKFISGNPWMAINGFGELADTLLSAVNPAYNVLPGDGTKLIDTTGGNQIINMDPAVLAFQKFTFKKISADANTITLTPTSGTIQELGPAAATYVFNAQGEAITVHNDGTNFYII